MNERIVESKVYVLGDNIDTDQIIPACYLNLVPTIKEEYAKLGSYALCGLPDTYPPFIAENREVTEYAILVAGRNFGCGSSREHAPIALGAAGVRAVVAESFARIFFRNVIATGELFPIISETRLCDELRTGETVRLDLDAYRLTRLRDGTVFTLKDLGAAAPVIAAGGLFAYARQTGMIAGSS